MTYTTQKKTERLNHLISFKMGDSSKKQLDELITSLNIHAKRESDRMRKFITNVYDKLNGLTKEVSQLQDENQKLKKKNKKLERFIEFASKDKVVRPQTQKASKSYPFLRPRRKPQAPTTEDLENKKRLEAALKETSHEAHEEEPKEEKLRVALEQIESKSEEPKRDFQQAKLRLPKSESLRHTKPIQKPHVSMKPIEQPNNPEPCHWCGKPSVEKWRFVQPNNPKTGQVFSLCKMHAKAIKDSEKWEKVKPNF